jgi:polar amino acid transport system substrate-binding protein
MSSRRTRLHGILAFVVLATVLCSCAGDYQATPVVGPPATAAAGTPTAAPACDRNVAVQSFTPPTAIPQDLQGFPSVARIRARGFLTIGVSADTLRLGARNPINGKIEGFDIDMAKLVATAIFSTDVGHLKFRALNAADRVPALQKGEVDLVARALTITCERWEEIAFSAEYYRAGQKLLVKLDAKETKLEDFSKRKVCSPTGSTNLESVRAVSGVIAVPAASNAACLVLLQQGQVEAIASDDVILAGLAAQDPFVKVVGSAINEQPYGLGINQDQKDFVRYVNAVLAAGIASGKWRASYTTWLAPDLGPAPAPPTPRYGRE